MSQQDFEDTIELNVKLLRQLVKFEFAEKGGKVDLFFLFN